VEDLNHFRGSILTKIVIDRQLKITAAHDGTAIVDGPRWPEATFFLNHINHVHYHNGQGTHLFQLAFGMVRNMTGIDELMGGIDGDPLHHHCGARRTLAVHTSHGDDHPGGG